MVSVSAMTRSEEFGGASFPAVINSLGQRPSIPQLIRLKVDKYIVWVRFDMAENKVGENF